MQRQPFRLYWQYFLVLLVISMLCCSSCDDEDKQANVKPFKQLEPADGVSGAPLQPVFSWEKSDGASHYTLAISLQSDFSSIVFEKSGITQTTYTLDAALDKGFLYFWKVSAVNSAGAQDAENAGIAFRTIVDSPAPSPGISVYFVSPTGEDNPDKGSQQSPFKTLAYAATRVPAQEADTIRLSAGTFEETEPSLIPLGVSVVGAGQDKTILSSQGVTIPSDVNPNSADYKLWYDGSLIQLVSQHRLIARSTSGPAIAPASGEQVIRGFTIDGQNKMLKAGIWVENRNQVTMDHITFRNLQQRGAVFAPGNKNWYTYPEYYMTGITIHDCKFINSGKDLPDETLGNLNLAQLDGADIYNISIEDNEGYGIKFIYDGYFKNTKIHDCTIRLSESDTKWGEDIAVELWNLGPGNAIYNINCNTWVSVVNHPEVFGTPNGTENMKISSVRIIDVDGNSNKEAIEVGAPGVEVAESYFENKGIGIAIWDMGRNNIIVRNNIFFNTTLKTNWASGAAIYIDNSRTWEFTGIKVYNNVFDNHDITIKIKGNLIGNVSMANNVFLHAQTAEVQAEGDDIMLTHNLKFSSASSWNVSGVTINTNNVMGDPLFLKTGERFESFYKPNAASTLIDNGIDVGLNFKGTAPDIGCIEY